MAGRGQPGTGPGLGFQAAPTAPRPVFAGAPGPGTGMAYGGGQMAYGATSVFGGGPGMQFAGGTAGSAGPGVNAHGSFGAPGNNYGAGGGNFGAASFGSFGAGSGTYSSGAASATNPYAGAAQAYMAGSAGGPYPRMDGDYRLEDTGMGEEDYGADYGLDWQDQRQAEWQERIQAQYFSRWSVDKLDEWQAYQAKFDAAHDSGMGQAVPSLVPPQWDNLGTPAAHVVSKEDAQAGEVYRRENEMQVISAFSSSAVPVPVRSFEAASLPPQVFREIEEAGFVEPTPIQAQCWPILGAGHDLIGIAKSGSGKTLAFLGPGFAHVLRSPADVQKGPMVLVLAPTRELARQIQLEALKFGRSSGILCCAVTGGEPKGEQLEWVKRGCHVIVATPGRLNEFLEREHVWLGQVGYAVLDEADRMLDMGFEPQIRRIIEECPKGPERQTLLFSATWPKAVRQLAFDFLRRPLHVHIGEMNAAKANTDVEQRAVMLDRAADKDQALVDTLKEHLCEGELAIVFVATKKSCQDVSQRLQVRGFGVAEMNGDKDQRERDIALHSFVNKQKNVLVATDVASRGLDIKGVKWVVNYDAANTPEDHVHRIGRTGRAGEKGISFTFLVKGDPSDIRKARAVIEVMETAGQEVPADLRQLAGTSAPRGGSKAGSKGGGYKGGGFRGGSKGGGRGGGSKGGFKGGGKSGPGAGGGASKGGFGGGFGMSPGASLGGVTQLGNPGAAGPPGPRTF